MQAGEASGSLGPSLRRLADDLTARRVVVEEIRNALLYPAFLLITAVVGISILLLVVVPNLENLFGARSREALPVVTQVVIAVSHGLRDFGLFLLMIAGLALAILMAAARTSKGRSTIHQTALRLPIMGSLVQAIETGRFARAFSSLLAGGVAMAQAMPLAVQTLHNDAMRRGLERAHGHVLTGVSLGDAIAASRVLPGDALGLVRMGERTGTLDRALGRAAALYEGRAARRLKALTTVLTPVLTIGFGLLAGVIIYAMVSTILSINDLAAP